MQLAPKIKRILVRSTKLLFTLLISVPSVMGPVGDFLLELVALKLLVRLVLDGSLDGKIEGLARFHELLAELVGLAYRDARSVPDVLLRGCEGGLSISALEEDGLFGERVSGSVGDVVVERLELSPRGSQGVYGLLGSQKI